MGETWKAMAEASRGQILVLPKDGEETPSEIAGNFGFTISALSTHLRAPREANLVSERESGQNRFYPPYLGEMSDMVRSFEEFWNDSLSRLKSHAESKQ